MKIVLKPNMSLKNVAVVKPQGAIDNAYKAIGSMNFPERKKRMKEISAKNNVLFDRLMNVQSTIQTDKKLKSGEKLAALGRKMSKFEHSGVPKKDPLVELHKFHGAGLSP